MLEATSKSADCEEAQGTPSALRGWGLANPDWYLAANSVNNPRRVFGLVLCGAAIIAVNEHNF